MYSDWVRPRPATPDQLVQLLDHTTTATGQLTQLVTDTNPRDAIAGPELDPILDQLEQLTTALDQALLHLAAALVASLAIDDHRDDPWDTTPLDHGRPSLRPARRRRTHQHRAGRNIAAARAVLTGAAHTELPAHTERATQPAEPTGEETVR